MTTNNNITPSPYFNTSQISIEKARRLRKNMTETERKLWFFLRNRKFKGLKFRRQHPVDVFITDFICIEKKLVVELDGEIHNTPEQIEYDKDRTKILKGYQLKVIRFTNHQINNNIYNVLKEIERNV